MKDRKYITDFVPEVCKGIKNKLDQLEDDDAWLRKENARLREAITDFAKADKGLRIDYSKYCDKNGYPPDWVWDQVDISHDMWDKAVAKLNEIAEEILREGNDEGE